LLKNAGIQGLALNPSDFQHRITPAIVARVKRILIILSFCSMLLNAAPADSPAHKALDHFRKGVNFGNYLEVPPSQSWALTYTLDDIQNVKREGFDHIRLPVGWHHYAGGAPDFRLRPEIYSKVDFVVTNALKQGLSILINIHHFDEFTSNPTAQTDKFVAIWRQIAQHYEKSPQGLAFELLNEPKDAATTEVICPIYDRAIKEIRKTNPTRTIFVGPSRWNSLDEVSKLSLAEDDHNIIVTVHCYDPFLFTHQGANWTGANTATTGIVYPGPPKEPLQPNPKSATQGGNAKWFQGYNTLPTADNPSSPKAFTARMEKVAKWGEAHGRPIHLGEFGAYEKADPTSRARYYKDMRQTAERLGFGWAIWDWKAGFKYWDKTKPAEGMREALFGKN
jgi:endoglucanase